MPRALQLAMCRRCRRWHGRASCIITVLLTAAANLTVTPGPACFLAGIDFY